MSLAHTHLLINHLAIFGLLFGGGLLLYAVVRGSDLTARISLVFFVLAGLGATGAYLTGEGAEEIVEGQAGVLHSAIETHEEVAIFALVAAAVLGGLALVLLFWYRHRSIPQIARSIMLALSLIAISTVAYTSYTGGKINHPELRENATQVENGPVPSEEDNH